MLAFLVITFSALTITASAASMPTTLSVEPSETNGIPSQINLFRARTGGTSMNPTYTYQLYLPGNAVSEECFLSWDGEATATVGNVTYESGACPIPSSDTAQTYTFRDENQTLGSLSLISYKGSAGVTPVFIEIDETLTDENGNLNNTIAAMKASKDNSCKGNIYINGQEYAMSKMKGRGNATWDNAVDKKPYNITLDSKINFPGIDSGKTKKWSLLAEVLDRSLLCNRSGYHLAHELGIGQDTASADVWMNGEYQGCYTVTPKTDSFVTKSGFMIEQDNYKEPAVASGGDPQFRLDGLNSHVESSTWTSSYNFITVKKMGDDLLGYGEDGEPDESPENMEAKANEIKAWLQEAWDAMRSSDGYNSDGKYYTDYIDIESFAKMYLMHEFVKSYDVCAGSILFYRNGQTDDDKLMAGPLWDLDNAMGSTYSNSYLGDVSDRRSAQGSFIEKISNYRTYGEEYKTSIYKTLSKHADFMEEVYLQYNKNKQAFESLVDDTDQMIESIEVSARMNHAKVTDIGNNQGKNNHYYSSAQTLGTSPYTQSYVRTTTWDNYAANLRTYIDVRSNWFFDTYNDPDYHEHDYEITVTQEPTCTDTGLATYTCTICGDTLTDQIVPALGHDFDDDSGICTRCGFTAPKATITCSTGASVTVYKTKNYDVVKSENAAFANPRDSSTGVIDSSGEGQINFKVNIEDGYELVSVTAEPKASYKNLKLPDETEVENGYRLTKVKDDLVITVTAVCVHDYQAEVTQPTCTEQGYTTYTCSRCGDSYVDDYVDALGHDWAAPAYEWAEDNSTVTAVRVCRHDGTHRETETVDTTSEITKPAACEEAGVRRFTAAFENEAFTAQTKDVAIDPNGHDWGDVEYEWSADNSKATATVVCRNDPDHVETETVDTTSEVTKPAACEEAGNRRFTAVFENELFTVQTKDVAIDPTGHDWGDATYEWEGDNSTVTATKVCRNDPDHVETETVDTTSEVTKLAACEEAGVRRFTAAFENEAFTAQTKDVAIEPTGHDYGAPMYVWSDDNGLVTATVICNNDPGHIISEQKETTSEVTKPAACEEAGNRRFTAVFENEQFTVQTRDVAIEPTGHDYGEWEDSGDTYHQRACSHGCGNVEKALHEYDEGVVPKPATADEEGQMTYTCGVCGHVKTEVIPKLDPDPVDPIDQMGEDGTALGRGASYEAADAAITDMKNDSDPAGSKIAPLVLRSSRQTTGSVKVTWKGPSDAVKYVIYGNRCGKSYRMKKIKELGSSARSVTLKKIVKKIKKGTCYKLILVALDSNNDVVSASKVVHVFTKGGKSCNYKSVTTKAKKNRVTLKAGKSFSLKAKGVKQSSKLRVTSHRKMRYQSTNAAIAAVTSKGTIRAKSKGVCYVYVYTQNGVYKRIKVTVK